MTLKTVPVTGTLFNPNGSVAANASVVATLTVVDTDGGIVVPSQVTATADSSGVFTLNLWPNSRGVNGSQYRVRAQMPGALPGVLLVNLLITVPDSDPAVPVPISVITNRTGPAALSDAKAAMLAAQGFALQAAAAVAYIYPGAYSTPPTTRPPEGLGAAMQAGDRANFSDGYEYKFTGSAWVSDSKSAAVNATAAAASRAQVLYIVQGSFVPGTPPTHRDDGSAIQSGDYAFFTDNIFRRYNGTTWVASDINTANLAASSGSSLVGFLQSGTGAAARTLQDKAREVFSVKDFGAVGDGVTNDTAAFNAAIAAMALRKGGTLLVPQGTYKITSTLDFSALTQFKLQGEGKSQGQASTSSSIKASFVGVLIKYEPAGTGNSFHIDGLYLQQSDTDQTSVTIQCGDVVASTISNCKIDCNGGYGILADFNTFTLNITGCSLTGSDSSPASNIGILATSHTNIVGCDITHWREGVRISGACVNVQGCRLEVNRIGINVGVAKDGTTFILSRSAILGNSMEANDTAISVNAAANCLVSGIGHQGSVNSPSGQSKIGVFIHSATETTFQNLSFDGSYSDCAFRLDGGNGNTLTIRDSQMGNAFGGTSKVWDVKTGLGSGGGTIIFENTNYTVRPDDTVSRGNSRRHGQLQYLSQIDYMNPNVEGKNLRGKNIALASGVSTKAIAFTGAGHAAGNAALNTATAGVTGGATLAAGTYYYLATAVTAHGESAGTSEKSVTVGGANNSVTLAIFGMTADGFKRRIYRGTASGVYDGYFETALNSNVSFVDIGQAFTGVKSPPSAGVDDTSMLEPDANYAVVVTPSWLTTVRVTGKATTGFTVDFGTATPDAAQTIDWVIVR